MKVNIKLKEGFEDFEYEYKTLDSAAFDLRAAVPSTLTINPGEHRLISTGLFVEVPKGHMLHITPRSGLAFKNGISIVNSPGIIDSDYRGELGVVLINHGINHFAVNRGDRIAQASFVKVEQAEFNKVEELSDTHRGEGGFGSTGIK